MKIVVANTHAPFITGGAEFLASNLIKALKHAGHEVDFVNIPMIDIPIKSLEDQILAVRLLEIEKTIAGNSDLCIGLKFPAYYLKHSNKVAWVLHQYRGVYDHWGADFTYIHRDPEGERIRDVVHNADNLYLKESKRIYTISKNVTGRMDKYNDIPSTPLYHPCPDMDSFYCNDYGDYILMPSRICVTKRQMLAVEAMKHTKSDIKLYIVGKADEPDVYEKLKQFVCQCGLEDRVRFFDFVGHEEKLELYANARAVMFIPSDEDYGYITLEGMSACKTILTAADSGGPLEFIENDKTGLVVSPDPVELAKAVDEVAGSKAYARELGLAAKKHLADMNITWDNTVRELTK